MRMTRFFRRTATMILLGLALCAALAPAPASAGLAITPTTVVMQGRDRYADLTIINTDKVMHSYSLDWRFYRMEQDTGSYKLIDQSITPFDLSKHLVFSPKRITLGPSSAQKIRFALRLNGEAPPPGDYRAHFVVEELPQETNLPLPQDNTLQEPGKRSVTAAVNINFSFTMPIIYRVGESTDSATLETIEVARNPKNGKITMTVPVVKTQSAFGFYGKIRVEHVDGGKVSRIGGLGNVNIFPETTRRVFSMPLKVSALQGGTLRVILLDRDDPKRVYDTKEIPIQ